MPPKTGYLTLRMRGEYWDRLNVLGSGLRSTKTVAIDDYRQEQARVAPKSSGPALVYIAQIRTRTEGGTLLGRKSHECSGK